MIWYALVSAVLIYCFEIIGRYVLSVFKIDNFKCCFGIGLIVFLAYSYITTSLITALNGSFYVVSVIYIMFFLVFFGLVIKDRKKISFKIDPINILLLIIFVFIMCLYAYNTTLGDLNGFDSTFYLNLVTSNIKSNQMNLGYYTNSISKNFISKTYTFQTFYYIASCFSYIFSNLINVLHKTYYQTVYIWVFQILFNAFFYSLVVNSINVMKKKEGRITYLVIILFFLFSYGRVYYYNVFGFYGNTFRIITVGYSTLILYLLTKKTKDNKLLLLFMISLIASASVSSSSLFTDIFIFFGSYFVLCKKYDNILKYYSVPLLFILTNLLTISLNLSIIYSILISIFISLALFLFGESINKILSKNISLYIILFGTFIFMFISSLLTTGNIFDFTAFLSNHSEGADMTINYFNLSSRYLILLKIFILVLLILSIPSVKKEPFVKFSLILFLCFFNPFCCPYLYKVLIVYFRAFDIIVNPFTIILFIYLLFGYIKEKLLFKIALLICIIFVSCQSNILKPLYYGDYFEPEYNYAGINNISYNSEFKTSQYEKEVIDIISNDCIFYDKNDPYIITPSILMQSFFPKGRFLYERTYWMSSYESNPEKQLFAIFFPERFLGDHAENIIPEYDNFDRYIKEAGIDYLVIDKTKEYYDENNNVYSYLHIKVSEKMYPMFENDRYIVYRCFYQ